MAKFRVGERVRYVGDRRKADWIDQTGVVAKVSIFGEYRVQWDEGHHCSTNYGSGIREASLEPVIDWSQPVELNDGTPLVVLNQWEHHASLRTRDGRDHPAQPNSPRWRLEARLNNGLVNSNHKFYVRNVLVPKTIDPKKPLLIDAGAYGTGPADFITETSEGHFLVGAKDRTFNWCIFDKEGQFVRSSDGSGKSLLLRNVPQIVERYIPMTNEGMVGYKLAKLPGQQSDSYAHIKFVFTDGILTDVSIVSPNKVPFHVD